jgi:hypothetical protein
MSDFATPRLPADDENWQGQTRATAHMLQDGLRRRFAVSPLLGEAAL